MRHLTRAFRNTAYAKIRFKVHQIPIDIKYVILHLIIYMRLHLFLIKIHVKITNSWVKNPCQLCKKTNKIGPVCFLWKPDLNVNVWKLKTFAYICQNLYIYTQWKCVTTSNVYLAWFSKCLQNWSQRCLYLTIRKTSHSLYWFVYIDISETLKSQIQMFVFIIVLFIRHTSAEINEVLNNEPSIEM